MQFHTKLAGVTHDGRQGIIRNLHRMGELDTGTELVLQREPSNPYDSHAVAVLTKSGQNIGYLPKDTARQVSININSGMTYRAYVSAVTGGDAGYAYGVNLRIECEEHKTFASKIKNEGDEIMSVQTNYCKFTEALRKENFNFKEDAQEGRILVPQIGIDSSMRGINILIHVREDDCILFATYDNFKVLNNNMATVGELLMRINDCYLYPSFLLNYDEQTIWCKQRYEFVGELATVENATEHLYNLGLHMEKFGNAIMGVSLGLQSPKDAVNSVEK